jgi:hypothetical protein
MSFKELDQSKDISTQLSAINEVMPITGTLFSGATSYYVQNFVNITSGSAVSGGFWKTVYDGSPTSISSSALVDLTYGISTGSILYNSTLTPETFLRNEKNRVYEEMARILLGDGSALFNFNSTIYHELFFVLLKRRIFKDEVKKGSVTLNIQMSGTDDALTLTDGGAPSVFTVGPAGDEADLFSGSTSIGKVYYNAGIVAFMTGVFKGATADPQCYWSGSIASNKTGSLSVAITGAIDNVVDGLRNRINLLQFQNQTNLHSTIYFCRALNSEFNYSTNPTFVDGDGRIVVTSGSDNQTRSYITKIGLYDINDNLLAVASPSEPVKKSPDSELIFRTKLSY